MNLISEDYLMHYGVKGMKWGVRHDPERVGRVKSAKANYKAAKKQYSKDFDRAYNYSSRHMISQYIKKSPTYAESNKRWETAMKSAEAVNKAKNKYKTEKKNNKVSLKQTLDNTYGKVGKKQKYTQKNQFYKMAGKNFMQSMSDGADFYKKSYKSIKSGKVTEIGKHYANWLNQDVNVLGVTGYKKMKRSRYISGTFNPLY